jgi:hypothetical protein
MYRAGFERVARVELRGQHSFSDRLRLCNRAEERLRIKGILAGFIDDPQHVVFLGGGIAQRHILRFSSETA